uniref:Aspartic peptidase DDI1-type domain-containing protein n=1 Tax=Manihot esculenta TaxID=3983 RepID=A0A2C9UIZ6_MANES
MHLVNAISEVSPLKGLLYVNIRLNSAEVLAMADTGASHNFLAERMAKTLGLEVTKSSNRMKAVNSAARDVIGMAANVMTLI